MPHARRPRPACPTRLVTQLPQPAGDHQWPRARCPRRHLRLRSRPTPGHAPLPVPCAQAGTVDLPRSRPRYGPALPTPTPRSLPSNRLRGLIDKTPTHAGKLAPVGCPGPSRPPPRPAHRRTAWPPPHRLPRRAHPQPGHRLADRTRPPLAPHHQPLPAHHQQRATDNRNRPMHAVTFRMLFPAGHHTQPAAYRPALRRSPPHRRPCPAHAHLRNLHEHRHDPPRSHPPRTRPTRPRPSVTIRTIRAQPSHTRQRSLDVIGPTVSVTDRDDIPLGLHDPRACRGLRQCSTCQRWVSCTRPPGSGTRSRTR